MSRKYKAPRLREAKWGNETTGYPVNFKGENRDEEMKGRVNKKRNADPGQSREIRMGQEMDE
jgi:hypothetical protein